MYLTHTQPTNKTTINFLPHSSSNLGVTLKLTSRYYFIPKYHSPTTDLQIYKILNHFFPPQNKPKQTKLNPSRPQNTLVSHHPITNPNQASPPMTPNPHSLFKSTIYSRD
ncbi:hypothetical protein EYC80_000338 [Monilinia laxa]|uniref:Uncharacterized protein n=1 Tax=Monilinia laxa TaxID=61186 RepID=A0A5N6KA94_MONLA|nr:hypothetical protein EYC80_000338 [Monilinia laxa]